MRSAHAIARNEFDDMTRVRGGGCIYRNGFMVLDEREKKSLGQLMIKMFRKIQHKLCVEGDRT